MSEFDRGSGRCPITFRSGTGSSPGSPGSSSSSRPRRRAARSSRRATPRTSAATSPPCRADPDGGVRGIERAPQGRRDPREGRRGHPAGARGAVARPAATRAGPRAPPAARPTSTPTPRPFSRALDAGRGARRGRAHRGHRSSRRPAFRRRSSGLELEGLATALPGGLFLRSLLTKLDSRGIVTPFDAEVPGDRRVAGQGGDPRKVPRKGLRRPRLLRTRPRPPEKGGLGRPRARLRADLRDPAGEGAGDRGAEARREGGRDGLSRRRPRPRGRGDLLAPAGGSPPGAPEGRLPAGGVPRDHEERRDARRLDARARST